MIAGALSDNSITSLCHLNLLFFMMIFLKGTNQIREMSRLKKDAAGKNAGGVLSDVLHT